jgi:hypothetical protein
MRNIYLFLLSCSIFCIQSCSTPEEKVEKTEVVTSSEVAFDYEKASEPYKVENYFPGDLKDTLLTNMVTFIYKRPTASTNKTRTNPEFRGYYVKNAPFFRYAYHHMTADSIHYFYLIRPARSVDGDKRGVGGKFKVNDKLELIEFEEIFNTQVLGEKELEEKGLTLFEEMVNRGNVDRYLTDKELIEWPDDRLKYHKEMREWRYVD